MTRSDPLPPEAAPKAVSKETPFRQQLIFFLLVMICGFGFVPGLPVIMAIASLFTQLRNRLWVQVVIWALAVVLSLFQIAPFVPLSTSISS
ncbi:MAG: hypothetical protein QM606_11065 [Leucobacter sp.]